LVIIWRYGVSFGWNYWWPASAAFNCPTIALPSPSNATSVA
jgi:hypothetical protein